MKYIKVEWPEIQDYMDNPEWWEAEKELEDEFSGGDIGDLEDAMG